MKSALVFLIIVGFLFRLWGIGHGLSYGDVYHPDTPKQMAFLHEYIDGDYTGKEHIGRDYCGYPSFHIHLAEWAYRALRVMARGAGYTGWKMSAMGLYLLARLMLAAMSAVTIYFIYKTGALLFNRTVGFLSSLLFAVHPFPISLAHFIMGDTAMVTFAVISAFYFSRTLKENRLSDFFWASFFAGLSASAKYNGILIVILGIFPLFCNRRDGRLSFRLLMLTGGALAGFIVGTPAVFVGPGEAVRSIFAFYSHTSNFGLGGHEFMQPRLITALRHVPENMHMFRESFGLVLSLLSIASVVWVLIRKRTAPYIFVLIFPISYLCIAVYAKPAMQPLYYLPVFPFLFILISVFVDSIKRRRVMICALFCIPVVMCVYASFREAFFFGHADTRRAACEWVCRNVPPSFGVSGSRYSIDDPYAGYAGERDSGQFFISSHLGGMPVPKKGILVKEFSLENAIPPVIHRNPSIKVFMIPREGIGGGFSVPPFVRCPAREPGTGLVFLNGRNFGIDPLQFQIKPGRKLVLVSEKPVEAAAVLLTNNFSPTVVGIRLGWRIKRVNLAPYQTKIVLFERPARGFPFTKYFYRLSIDKGRDSSQVFVRIAANPRGIERLYRDAGLHREAPELIESEGVRDIELSEEFLRSVNTVRFEGVDFASLHGCLLADDIRISCREGEMDCIHGPYYGFPRGKFIARYRCKITGVSSGSEIKLDVAARLGTKVIAETTLKPEETEGFIDVNLPFFVDAPAEILEFRITLKGKGEILLDYVEVFPDMTGGNYENNE